MRKRLTLLALLASLATTGYAQQVVRDDGVRIDLSMPWVQPAVEKDTAKIELPLDEDGVPIQSVWIKSWMEMKSSFYGKRFNVFEWELLKGGLLTSPEYYQFEDGSDNTGVTTV